jgi:hypothetical protein
MRRKLQLSSADVKHRHHVLLECITKDIQILRGIGTTIINTRDADGVAKIVGASIQNHVQRVNGKGGTANGDAVDRGSGITVDKVSTIIITIDSRRVKGSVNCVGYRSGIVIERCAGVDLAGINIFVFIFFHGMKDLQCTEWNSQGQEEPHRST